MLEQTDTLTLMQITAQMHDAHSEFEASQFVK